MTPTGLRPVGVSDTNLDCESEVDVVAHSIPSNLVKKPRPDFPLFPHATGRWAKKVLGKLHYFGKCVDDPKGKAALELWVAQKDACRKPRVSRDGLTVGELCNKFLAAKESQQDAGDIKSRTFADYYATADFVLESFGKTRLVDDVGAENFQQLRSKLAKRFGVHRLGNNGYNRGMPFPLRVSVVFSSMPLMPGLSHGRYDSAQRSSRRKSDLREDAGIIHDGVANS